MNSNAAHPAGAELRALVADRWQESAACASVDPEAWFPEQGIIPAAEVRRICADCPVNRSCLAVALLWGPEGIWAGTNPGQRRVGHRLLRRGVPAAAVIELLLAYSKRPKRPQRAPRRWAGYARPSDPPTGQPTGKQEAA